MKRVLKMCTFTILIISLSLVIFLPIQWDHETPDTNITYATTWADDYRKPSQGTGTEADPYLVSYANELAYFAYYTENIGRCNSYIKLIADIDLNGSFWIGIGNSRNPFSGDFDGQGHRISNMIGNYGLFGYVDGSNTGIIDVWLVNCAIEAEFEYAGGIAGEVYGQTLISGCTLDQNSYVQGNDATLAIGGIIGYLEASGLSSGIIMSCSNYGTVEYLNPQEDLYSGGIIGKAVNGFIKHCFNGGRVNGDAVGGIAGCAQASAILNCISNMNESQGSWGAGILYYSLGSNMIYNSVDVTEFENFSPYFPIISEESNLTDCTIENNYSILPSSFSDNSKDVYNLAREEDFYLDNSYWNNGYLLEWQFASYWIFEYEYTDLPILIQNVYMIFYNNASSGGIDGISMRIGETTNNVAVPTRDGYTFDGYYTLPNGQGNCYFDENGKCVQKYLLSDGYELYASWIKDVSNIWSDYYTVPVGNGTEGNPYQVYTANELAYFAYLTQQQRCNVYIILKNDIDLADYYWAPIGEIYDFTGQFDGQNHSIYNLNISSTADYQGLFGKVSYNNGKSIIQNVVIESGTIQGKNYVGGICGKLFSSDILRCVNKAKVVGSGQYVGGIVGYTLNYVNVYDSYQIGEVRGARDVGGIVGSFNSVIESNAFLDVSRCCSDGTVVGGNNIGGLIGSADGVGIFLVDSYAKGILTSTSGQANQLGGLIGYAKSNVSDDNYLISNCFFSGKITGITIQTSSGFYGNASANISNCYADIENSYRKIIGTNFSGWGYSPYLNNGLPLPKALSYVFLPANQDVYSFLVGLGFTQFS